MATNELPNELLQMIRRGEGYQIEYKESKTELPQSVYETVSSFSNREGGDLFLGVHDCTVITGVDPKYVSKIIDSFVTTVNNQNKINPALYLVAKEYVYRSDGHYSAVTKTGKLMRETEGEHHIIHIHIPVSQTVVRNNNRIYDRNNDADIDITNFSDMVFQCYARKQTTYYVNKVFPYFSVSDLRADLLERVRRMAANRKQLFESGRHEWLDMDDEELLRTSNLILTDEYGKQGITLAAILLFGTDNMIMSACAHHKTDCIFRVYNVDRYDDRDVILTNLLDSYERMFAFGQKHLNDSFVLDGIQSVSARDKILREIISNSLAHRDYSNAYVPKMIIEKDRIIVENGNRAHGIGALNLQNFEPFPKNPPISKIFREIGYADELGSGMRNSYKYTRLYSGGEPEFIEGDVFKIFIPIVESALPKVRSEEEDSTENEETAQKSENNSTENGITAQKVKNNSTENGITAQKAKNNSTESEREQHRKRKYSTENENTAQKTKKNSIENENDYTENEHTGAAGEILNRIEQDIILQIKGEPEITIHQVADLLGESNGRIRYWIDVMKKKGILKREGAQKNGKWIVEEN